jgi:hypothetical protein
MTFWGDDRAPDSKMMRRLSLAPLLAALTGYAATPRPQAPEKLNPPAGEVVAFQARGVGDQIYVCKSDPKIRPNVALCLLYPALSPDTISAIPCYGEIFLRR